MAAKRLIKELDTYNRDPSPAVAELFLLQDDNLFELRAVLMGPEGTGYEGEIYISCSLDVRRKSEVDGYDRRPIRPLN